MYLLILEILNLNVCSQSIVNSYLDGADCPNPRIVYDDGKRENTMDVKTYKKALSRLEAEQKMCPNCPGVQLAKSQQCPKCGYIRYN